ncbi:MAG: PspC domain-containing protein [Pseudomonadales bacterium]|nr:PspC domain-containing protein [Pseudomonadales bacterium]
MNIEYSKSSGQKGLVGGVCVEVANYFGFPKWLVRLVALLLLLAMPLYTAFTYGMFWVVLNHDSLRFFLMGRAGGLLTDEAARLLIVGSIILVGINLLLLSLLGF